MTEEEWLACKDPRPMLEFLTDRASNRRLRLFACGYCEMYRSYFADEPLQNAVQVAYRVADGDAKDEERTRAFGAAYSVVRDHGRDGAAEVAAYSCGNQEQVKEVLSRATLAFSFDIHLHPRQVGCMLLRDIFGNPFRPVTFSAE